MIFKYYTRVIEDIYIDLVNRFLLSNGRDVRCWNVEESLNAIKDRNKSIVRWGDGESFVLMGADIHFQESTPRLRKKMLEVVKDYSDDSPYYMCLPYQYISCSSKELKELETEKGNFFQLHKRTRYVYLRFFNKKSRYLSHFIFKDGVKYFSDKLRKNLLGFEKFVIVKSNADIVDKFFNHFEIRKSYSLVTIPGKNAFTYYDRILDEVLASVDNNNQKVDTLILISAGPCAKILVYELSRLGYVAYDIGKLFESSLGL